MMVGLTVSLTPSKYGRSILLARKMAWHSRWVALWSFSTLLKTLDRKRTGLSTLSSFYVRERTLSVDHRCLYRMYNVLLYCVGLTVVWKWVFPVWSEAANHTTDTIYVSKIQTTQPELRSFIGSCKGFCGFFSSFPHVVSSLIARLRNLQVERLGHLKKEELTALQYLHEKLISQKYWR